MIGWNGLSNLHSRPTPGKSVLRSCREKYRFLVDILGFEFERGLFPNVQDSIANAEAALSAAGKSGTKVVVEHGQVVKLSKDKSGFVKRERLTQHWTDWIDYWSVDFDFESKREIIRVQNPETGASEEQRTGDFIFENEWQSFRTKKDRSLDLKSAAHECSPGRHKIAVKVVDIFGNDTMTIVEVAV